MSWDYIPGKNHEGYPDPTAATALRNMQRSQQGLQSRRAGEDTQRKDNDMAAQKTHGLSRDPEKKRRHTVLYTLWGNIKYRCNNPKSKDYANYGGRGITICDEWANSYEAFHNWAIENGYREGLQIDRIDNNMGYSPDNCRWTTPKVNSNNRRNRRTVEFNGREMTITEIAKITGIPWQTLYKRSNDEVVPYIKARLRNER